MSDLAERAAATLKRAPWGERFVTFKELHALTPERVREFLEALRDEGRALGLVVEFSVVDNAIAPGIKFRWFPAA